VNENTPLAYREWMEAIADTLDTTVDESYYHNAMIQKVFEAIEEDGLTPRDRYNMIEEYEDQLFVETERQDGKKEIAKNMLAKGFDLKTISELTGLSLSEIESLANPLSNDEEK
jgi:predicted transposase/invertase (TIGR01784 family)